MTPKTPGKSGLSTRDGLAVSRVRFLTAEPAVPDRVRGPILASWQRSRELKVHTDQIDLPYICDPDVDSPLTRSAGPVLRNLHEQLDGQPVSIILTDPTGLVLTRLTADHDLERHLDTVRLAPGFSYGEQYAGTNGIGTALEAGGPTHVFGHEHYAENLEDLACAGVPIHHPVSGRTVGAVDLTCWRKDAGSLLLTLAKTTAEQIRQALLADTGVYQLELFHDYLRTCRRMSGIVFAVSSDMVLLNDHARTVLDPADQAALLAHATEALADRRHGAVTVGLPTGVTARMQFRPLHGIGQLAGVVVHVKLVIRRTSRPTAGGRLPACHCPSSSVPPRCGCAPVMRWSAYFSPASGLLSRASRESGSWRCSARCSYAGSRRGGSSCWTLRTSLAIHSGWPRSVTPCSRTLTTSPSGTSTSSTAHSCGLSPAPCRTHGLPSGNVRYGWRSPCTTPLDAPTSPT